MAIKTKYGLQVDAWGALVMDRGDLAEEVEQLVIQNLEERELENLTITKEQVSLGGSAREHVVVEQNLGGGGRATTLLRIVPRAKDLDLSWRLFEKNVTRAVMWGMSQGTLLVVGGFLTLAGVIGLIPPMTCVGVALLIPGIAMIGAALGWWTIGRKKTTASTTEQFDSRALANTAHWALMKALATRGVANQELQVLQPTSEPGLGKLMPTDILDELTETPKIGA